MPTLAELGGLWRRSLIRSPGGIDDTTHVYWLQSQSAFIDLRQPEPPRNFSHVETLADLSLEDCAWLARQEGFAGELTTDGEFFEWSRSIDYQPTSDAPDAGSLHWEGSCLIERGRYADYVEHWHRADDESWQPRSSLTLRAPRLGTRAAWVRVGRHFMWARARDANLSGAPRLAAVVAAAPLPAARALVDCEISYGLIEAGRCIIRRSTLPFRVGTAIEYRLEGDTLLAREHTAAGAVNTIKWDIIGRAATA